MYIAYFYTNKKQYKLDTKQLTNHVIYSVTM